MPQSHGPMMAGKGGHWQPGMNSWQDNSWREGDWMCPQCQIKNFAKRSACFQCGVPKPDNVPEPPFKRRRLTDAECPPTHPCVRLFGFCKAGDSCAFADFPGNACLLFLKGRCQFGLHCHEPHYTKTEDGSIVAVQNHAADASPPEPGCHPCVRVYGFCKLGNVCPFAPLPAEACLMHLKGRCRFGPSCQEKHLTDDELAPYNISLPPQSMGQW